LLVSQGVGGRCLGQVEGAQVWLMQGDRRGGVPGL